MSKKKSLGSSPIGYSRAGMDSFEFIPSISDSEVSSEPVRSDHIGFNDTTDCNETPSSNEESENVEKKIVSYYLEEGLINRLKKVADDQKMFYSTLVSNAIQMWLDEKSSG